MSLILLIAAITLVAIKIIATIWLVCQPDAKAVTATPSGRVIYYAGKVSPALLIAVVLVRGLVTGASVDETRIYLIMLAVAIIMAVVVVRRRAAGQWYGLAHAIRQRRQRRF